jgi:D-aspartate ligase
MTKDNDSAAVAFVLDISVNGVGIARSLGRQGIAVIAADLNPNVAGRRSRYCKPLAASQSQKGPEEFLAILLKEGEKYSEKAVLFPGSDEDVLFMSHFRRELAKSFRFSLPSERLLESLINKRKQYQLAKKIGLPCPDTFYPESLDEVKQIKDVIKYPVFVKPYFSHVWRNKYGEESKGFKVDTSRELVYRFREIFEAKLQAMIQSIIIGPDSNIVEVYAYMSKEHQPLATFVAKKLRQHPNSFGVGTCLISIHDDAALGEGLEFFRKIGYTGLGSIELKKDARDAEYKLLELNARLPHHNMHATCAGVNFPLIQYLDLTNHSFKEANDYKDGVLWVDDFNDFFAFYELNKNGQLSLFNWLRSIWRADCHSYFAWDDLKPFIKDAVDELSLLPRRYLDRKR